MTGVLIGYILMEVLFSRHHLPFLFIGFSGGPVFELACSFKGLGRLISFKANARAAKAQLTYTLKAKSKETEGRKEELRQFQERPLSSELLIFL